MGRRFACQSMYASHKLGLLNRNPLTDISDVRKEFACELYPGKKIVICDAERAQKIT